MIVVARQGSSWTKTTCEVVSAARTTLPTCAVTSLLMARNVRFPHGWHNPAHDQLPDLVLHNITLPFRMRYEVNKALRRLRKWREDADYRPGASLARVDAIHALRDAAFILHIVKVQRDA